MKYMASCITILLINVPYFISFTSIVVVFWILPDQISFHEIIFAWVPITTSAINPLIILTRTRDVRLAVQERLRGWVGRRHEVEHTQSNTQSTLASKTGHCPPLPQTNDGPFTVIANRSAEALDV